MSILARRLLLSLLIFATAGCVSLGTMQRAETLGAGHWQIGIEGSTQGVVPEFPNVGVAFRAGVSDWFDAGASVSMSGAEADMKVQITEPGSPVTVSIAPSFGGWPGWPIATNCPEGGCESLPSGYTNLTLPILIGIPLGANELIISPKLVNFTLWTRATVPGGAGNGADNSLYAGLTIGFAVRMAAKFQIVPEIGVGIPVLDWAASSQGTTIAPEGQFVGLPYGGIVTQAGVGFLFGN